MKKTTAIVQWVPKIIDIGVHYCEEPHFKRLANRKWIRNGVSKFFYAYDLTAYHVSSGPTPLSAIDSLLKTLWGTEILNVELSEKGKVVRNRLHLEHPESLAECRRHLREWKGNIIKGVEWRKWLAKEDLVKLEKLESA